VNLTYAALDSASLEDTIAAAWSLGLRDKPVDRDADFRTLGLSPGRAIQVICQIWRETSIDLPVNVFFEAPTVRRMVAAIRDGSAFVAPELVRLRAGDESAPLFVFPGHAGYLVQLNDLVRALDYPGPIYGIAFSGLDGGDPAYDRFELEAERSLRIMRLAQHAGPYRMIGYSIGGITALEVAKQLRAEGDGGVFLTLIDTPLNDHSWPYTVWLDFMARKLFARIRRIHREMTQPRPTPATPASAPLRSPLPPRRGTQLEYRFRNPAAPNYPQYSPYWYGEATPKYRRVGENVCRMKGFYTPSRYDGKVFFFASRRGDPLACDPQQVWPKYLPNAEWVRVAGNHVTAVFGRNAAQLAAGISARLARERGGRNDDDSAG
jgi:thioesterase domain-containing protein